MDVIKQIDYMIACLEMAKEEYRYEKSYEAKREARGTTTGTGTTETGHRKRH